MEADMRQKIGSGVLGWDGQERRSNRYGSVVLDDAPYSGVISAKAEHTSNIDDFVGARVRLTARVLESRESGHIGDLFLGIRPSKPTVGEEVDLGVGVLKLSPGYGRLPAIELHPLDDRSELWIDPYKLYRVHDQTVELFAELTEDESDAVVQPASVTDEAVGDGEVGIQVKCLREGPYRIPPKVERLGDGLFKMTQVGATAGERFKLEKA